MLTEEQETWIAHLDDKKKIEILPYSPFTKEVFKKIKKEIKIFLPDIKVFHCGSTALKILGQGEIDLYIPVAKQDFNIYLGKLKKHFGDASSIYPLRRARFVNYAGNTKVEIFLINKEVNDWKNLIRFESYLKKNKQALNEYIKIKEESNGLNIQQYYRKKVEFINKILNYAKGKFSRSHYISHGSSQIRRARRGGAPQNGAI